VNSILSNKLLKNAIDLQSIGIHELAWKYDYIIKVIKTINAHGIIILGGDVYRINDINKRISSTGDSWYFEKKLTDDSVAESETKAIDYISNYYNRNGECFCYSVVCEKSYMEQSG
jgi:hypothetical protein